jgi:hypothetical protein
MITDSSSLGRVRATVWLASWVVATTALAFPPAPHHLVYGMVRDEMGNPLNSLGADVLLETDQVALARTTIAAGSEPGVNYRLAIPLDSGATTDLYKPTALRPTVPFRMRVKIAGTTYLPIEMSGAAHLLTRPGESSRVDLTLGVDSDGDGLPDAWERAMIQMLGGNLGLDGIRPGDDSDADGLSNLDEYLAGTYGFDPADGFVLGIVPTAAGRPLLEFTAIRGRSYTIYGSEDMKVWTPVTFTLPGDAADAAGRANYRAAETRLIRAQISVLAEADPAWQFFKLQVR